jgi:hypothetical protein
MPFTLKDIERLKQEGKIRGFSVAGPNRPEPKKSKYGNKKVELDGMTFDSIKEGNRYLVLRARKIAGEISGLTMQTEFELTVNGEKVASYFADFTYYENGALIVEDVKSGFTRRLAVYRLKKKLMKECLGIEIKEV